MTRTRPSNADIADLLDHIADFLEIQDANLHRLRAYRNGADRARGMDRSLADMVMEGDGDALEELPDIGEGLARIITRYVRTGRSRVLDRLQGDISPEKMFQQVPGIGAALADRISSELDVQTLPELEQAAHDGRLEQVDGFGARRVENVRVSLAGMLSRSALRRSRERTAGDGDLAEPPVAVLLDVDREYRRKAEAGELHRIAPKRFNPDNESWLPILHTVRKGWDFTALYSNTARAHRFNKTHDWVVIYYERDGGEGQATVVTASRGALEGKRIVRGREAACEEYYGV